MNNPLAWKIGFLGAHGTGKTTAALNLAARLKSEDPGLRIGLLPEVARRCPYPVNQDTSRQAQKWIFHRQIWTELDACAHNDLVICDRTALDNLAYAQAANFGFALKYLPLAIDWMTSYRELYFLRPDGEGPADDGFRDTDLEFQLQIDLILAGWIKKFGIPAKAGIQSSR